MVYRLVRVVVHAEENTLCRISVMFIIFGQLTGQHIYLKLMFITNVLDTQQRMVQIFAGLSVVMALFCYSLASCYYPLHSLID